MQEILLLCLKNEGNLIKSFMNGNSWFHFTEINEPFIFKWNQASILVFEICCKYFVGVCLSTLYCNGSSWYQKPQVNLNSRVGTAIGKSIAATAIAIFAEINSCYRYFFEHQFSCRHPQIWHKLVFCWKNQTRCKVKNSGKIVEK